MSEPSGVEEPQGLIARVLARAPARARLAALPRLESLSASDEAARARLQPLLTAHAAELVRAAESAAATEPVMRRLAMAALSSALPPRWPEGETGGDLDDVLGAETARIAYAAGSLMAADEEKKAGIRVGLAIRLRDVGRRDEARALVSASVDELRQREGGAPSLVLASALNALAVLEREAGREAAALRLAHESVRMHITVWTGSTQDRLLGAWACLSLGVLYTRAGEDKLGRYYMSEAVRLGDGPVPAGERDVRISALTTLATHYPSEQVQEDLNRLAVPTSRIRDRANLASARGFVLGHAGDHAAARPHHVEAVQLRRLELDQAPDRPTDDLANALRELGATLVELGSRSSGARALAEAASLLELGARNETIALRAPALVYRHAARALQHDGELDGAEQHIRDAIRLARRVEHPRELALTLAVGAFIAWDRQQPRLALARADEGAEAAAQAVLRGETSAEDVAWAEQTPRALRAETARQSLLEPTPGSNPQSSDA